MTIFKSKDFTISDGEVILDVNDDHLPSKISSQNDQNIVVISTPDQATAGTFDCYVELTKDSGFFSVPSIAGSSSSIQADKVGAQVTDGEVQGWSFSGSPYRIKVKATGVTGLTLVKVVVSQNGG